MPGPLGGRGARFTLKDGCPNTTTSKFRQERKGINRLGESSRTETAQGPVDDEAAGNRSDRASGNRRTIHRAVDQHRSATIDATTNLNPHRARTTFGVGRPQHRKTGCEPVASSR